MIIQYVARQRDIPTCICYVTQYLLKMQGAVLNISRELQNLMTCNDFMRNTDIITKGKNPTCFVKFIVKSYFCSIRDIYKSLWFV